MTAVEAEKSAPRRWRAAWILTRHGGNADIQDGLRRKLEGVGVDIERVYEGFTTRDALPRCIDLVIVQIDYNDHGTTGNAKDAARLSGLPVLSLSSKWSSIDEPLPRVGVTNPDGSLKAPPWRPWHDDVDRVALAVATPLTVVPPAFAKLAPPTTILRPEPEAPIPRPPMPLIPSPVRAPPPVVDVIAPPPPPAPLSLLEQLEAELARLEAERTEATEMIARGKALLASTAKRYAALTDSRDAVRAAQALLAPPPSAPEPPAASAPTTPATSTRGPSSPARRRRRRGSAICSPLPRGTIEGSPSSSPVRDAILVVIDDAKGRAVPGAEIVDELQRQGVVSDETKGRVTVFNALGTAVKAGVLKRSGTPGKHGTGGYSYTRAVPR